MSATTMQPTSTFCPVAPGQGILTITGKVPTVYAVAEFRFTLAPPTSRISNPLASPHLVPEVSRSVLEEELRMVEQGMEDIFELRAARPLRIPAKEFGDASPFLGRWMPRHGSPGTGNGTS